MNLSIKNVPEELVRKLKERAKTNHRSLQGEALSILEASVASVSPLPRKTVSEALDEVRRLDLPKVSEAAALVRADRDRDSH